MANDDQHPEQLPSRPEGRDEPPFAWRVIPAAITGFGGGLLATSLIPLMYVLFRHPIFHGEQVPKPVVAILTGCALAGVAWLVAARAWWTRHWFWAIVITLAGYLALILSLPDR